MSSLAATKSSRQIILEGLWYDNPIFCQILGICSTLAVTNNCINTLVMCSSLSLVTGFSAMTVSSLRNWTPRSVRMMVQVLIIAFYVIIVDMLLKAYWPAMSKSLGPYVGLIITNCIVMGRCEAFAGNNKPWPSFLDGLFSGLGYSVVLMGIAVIRELLGMGTIFGLAIPYFATQWDKWVLMVMPPGGFFILACVLWLCRSMNVKGKKS